MKYIILFYLAFSMLLSACGTAPAATPLPLAQATKTTIISTPIADTPTLAVATDTPLPATPTTMASLTVPPTSQPSRTLSMPETCPQVDGSVRAQFGPVFKGKKAAYHDARQVVLDFLNSGGDPLTAIAKLAENGVSASQLDVTADNVPEFLLPSGYFTIFGCKDGQYQTLLDLAPTENTGYEPVPLTIQDLNKNGVPELFIAQVLDYRVKYSLLEWDGATFAPIIPKTMRDDTQNIYIADYDIFTVGQSHQEEGKINGNWQVVDINRDGLQDISIKAGVNSSSDNLEEQVTLAWNGTIYAIASKTIESTPTATPTSTPLPFSATCDYKAQNIKYVLPEMVGDDAFKQSIESFLNAGGDPNHINDDFDVIINPIIKDLNKDGISEILFISQNPNVNNGYVRYKPYIFSCINGAYKSSLDLKDYHVEGGASINDMHESSMQILSTSDLNKNSLPEIVIRGNNCILNGCGNLLIAEWNGTKFASLIHTESGFDRLFYFKDTSFKDIDNDGIPEVIWTGGVPPESEMSSYKNVLPLRLETHVDKWDGTYYQPQPIEYSEPVYLFQAVQDGDRFSQAGQFDKAIKAYNNAIRNKHLDWWSKDRQDYLLGQLGTGKCQFEGECPSPKIDPAEKPTLQAYAYYRIMLAQLMLGKADLAESAYKELLSTYPTESNGPVITEMAAAFWQTYQASKNMRAACSRAIAFAYPKLPNKSFISYIGGGFQGFQMQTYEPKDVCPFK
jgi:tetratricopeptide (TPR) repeat protein